jgi:tRNA-dihydrouridine synthase B
MAVRDPLCSALFATIPSPMNAIFLPPKVSPWPKAWEPLSLGPVKFANRVFVAPMAGVTDRPYRQLCKSLGAGYVVAEMAASNPNLWHSVKTARRINHEGETSPTSVQLAGSDPDMMAEAARFNVERGAQIIDINMGCPAKKVCNVWAGSALMNDLDLAHRIIESVVKAVSVPVTVKMRTGPDPRTINAPELAQIAEQAGVAMIAIHGRSRACAYHGPVNYEAIATVKQSVSIPVVANGDIDSAEKALHVLKTTGADAVMLGRAAQGRPWLPGHVDHFLKTGEHLKAPSLPDLRDVLLKHLDDHYGFYGDDQGVRSARKHIAWYLQDLLVTPENVSSKLAPVYAAMEPATQKAALLTLLNHDAV